MVNTIGLTILVSLLATAPAAPSNIDLSVPFHTRSPWRFTAIQEAAIADAFSDPDDKAPGRFTLCLSHDGQKDCEPTLFHTLGNDTQPWSGPHFLREAEIKQPEGRPLLLIQSAGLWSGDGDYGIETIAFRYNATEDRFVVAYLHVAEHNRNGDVRYMVTGPLRGAFISADATEDAPYAYWIVVNKIGAGDIYHPVLRYRSATRYGDGNPLAVIDSEMPNIEQRLHLWRPSQSLPLPPRPCAKPHLVKGALWCQ